MINTPASRTIQDNKIKDYGFIGVVVLGITQKTQVVKLSRD